MSFSSSSREEASVSEEMATAKKKCKIRKRRNCSSSSTSSSLVRKYRFKRAILMGKRGGSTTPAPMWETINTPAPEINSKEASSSVSVSARKLAATLWEINKVPSSNKKKDGHNNLIISKEKEILKPPLMKSREKVPRLLSQSASLPPHLSDPSYTPLSEQRMQRRDEHGVGGGGHHRTMSATTQKLQPTAVYHAMRGSDSQSNPSLIEGGDHHSRVKTHHKTSNIGAKSGLKEVSNGLATSKELLKLLHHVRGLEDQRSLSTSLFSALRFELDRAFIEVDRFIREKRSDNSEIGCLLKHFAEEKAAWKSKERERIRSAISCVTEELKAEKKLRRQTERLNKKIGKELAETREALSGAVKELEREKRAKEILEQVCDELARGIGEDRAQVEKLKRESEKVREEVEKERQMLQLADVLREERVQMKLSEARHQFEEKNAAVEQLRNELEAYLRSKIGEKDDDGSPKFEKIKELEAYLKEINFGSSHNAEKEEEEEEEGHGGDDSDSDLHSIEINMDNNNRTYKWSYVSRDKVDEKDDGDSKRVSVDRQFKGRKSISEKIHWGSICLNRSANDIDLEFGENRSWGHADEFHLVGPDAVSSQAKTQEYEDEIKRYKAVKGLADHILSGSEIALIPGFAKPY